MPQVGVNLEDPVVVDSPPIIPIFMGIDPGVKGGIATIDETIINQYKMPDTPKGVWNLLSSIDLRAAMNGRITQAVLEEVPHSIFGGAKSSSSKLYGGFKALEMALTAAGIHTTLIKSKKWQELIGIKKMKGESDAHWKQRLRQKARILFPARAISLETSDALLMAECCRRLYEEKQDAETRTETYRGEYPGRRKRPE